MTTQVLVLGAGYTGMMAALGVARRTRDAQVTLVNPTDLFTERLRSHQVAAGQKLGDHRIPALVAGTGVRFVQGRATRIDTSRSLGANCQPSTDPAVAPKHPRDEGREGGRSANGSANSELLARLGKCALPGLGAPAPSAGSPGLDEAPCIMATTHCRHRGESDGRAFPAGDRLRRS
jgi:2-polyprenyl-6-methoxyphenol hydroxylase-like FAD-dependent oxidoreductase